MYSKLFSERMCYLYFRNDYLKNHGSFVFPLKAGLGGYLPMIDYYDGHRVFYECKYQELFSHTHFE